MPSWNSWPPGRPKWPDRPGARDVDEYAGVGFFAEPGRGDCFDVGWQAGGLCGACQLTDLLK
jgi:hypothetical protein